jgi:hypothetical protein
MSVAIAVVAAVAIGAWWARRDSASGEPGTSRDREPSASATEDEAQQPGESAGEPERTELTSDTLRDESAGLMPSELEGIALGMTEAELRAERDGLARRNKQVDSSLRWLEEELSNDARVLYGLHPKSDRLAKVQVMSHMASLEGVQPHLTAMTERYGSPTGLWECPDTGGVPTLRFTWRKNVTTVSDVFLFYPGGAATTLYVAPSDSIADSLREGECRPTTLQRLKQNPPVATPQQLRSKQGRPAPAMPAR